MNTNKYGYVMTQREVATALKMGRGMVAYLENSAMEKIKKELAKRKIDARLLFKDEK